jgi:DNA-binding response OmpR family regulator
LKTPARPQAKGSRNLTEMSGCERRHRARVRANLSEERDFDLSFHHTGGVSFAAGNLSPVAVKMMNPVMESTTFAPPSQQSRILVVEDEEKMRASVAEGLAMEGCDVSTAPDGAEAIALLEKKTFHLIVLDWMLPRRSGLDVLHFLRSRGNLTPVLMLTVRDAIADRVLGLESGADDYLPKPFAFAELVARARALLRRPSPHAGHILRYHELQLDTRARVARRAGREIPLTPREVEILEYFLRNQGEVITREMLERDVWKQTRRFTSLNNVIDVQIMRLRKKIEGENGERMIHTLRGVGYRLDHSAAP